MQKAGAAACSWEGKQKGKKSRDCPAQELLYGIKKRSREGLCSIFSQKGGWPWAEDGPKKRKPKGKQRGVCDGGEMDGGSSGKPG